MRRRRPPGTSPFALPELDSCRATDACLSGILPVAPMRPACFDVSGNGFWVTTPMSGKTKRDKPWMFRTYAGHSTAKASNELYRQNLAKGQTGLSVAFDLPTQTGYDSDHALARGEVGRTGVPIGHRGVAVGALRRRCRGAGGEARRAPRHDPERHHEGVPVARYLHLSSGAEP